MKTPLSPGVLAKRPLVCRSFHIVAGVPDDRYIHCTQCTCTMYHVPMLTPMFKPGVFRPIAATSVHRRTTLDLEINVVHGKTLRAFKRFNANKFYNITRIKE